MEDRTAPSGGIDLENEVSYLSGSPRHVPSGEDVGKRPTREIVRKSGRRFFIERARHELDLGRVVRKAHFDEGLDVVHHTPARRGIG